MPREASNSPIHLHGSAQTGRFDKGGAPDRHPYSSVKSALPVRDTWRRTEWWHSVTLYKTELRAGNTRTVNVYSRAGVQLDLLSRF